MLSAQTTLYSGKRILEALQIQPLSQEEMTARHILGRLYGPIATCIERTRNDRLYNKPLWEKARVHARDSKGRCP